MASRLTERRWISRHQPQTLQVAVMLLYWNAALSLLAGLATGGFADLSILLLVGDVAGGYGVANERKWGYIVAVIAAAVPLALLISLHHFYVGGFLTLVFQVALVALLLHPQSREYYRIWFR